MNANETIHCPCGPSCACSPCLCTENGCGTAPEGVETEGPACFCGTGCQCEA